MSGFFGLLQKEVLRFWRVVFQTVGCAGVVYFAVDAGVFACVERAR